MTYGQVLSAKESKIHIENLNLDKHASYYWNYFPIVSQNLSKYAPSKIGEISSSNIVKTIFQQEKIQSIMSK